MPRRSAETPMFMNKRQLAVIHLAKKALCLDDDDYRAILQTHGGVETSRDLDTAGFRAIMARFAQLGFTSDWAKRTYGERRGMASPAQIALIRNLWREWADQSDQDGLNAWLENSFQCSALRFASPEVAQKAITALRAMTKRKQQQAIS